MTDYSPEDLAVARAGLALADCFKALMQNATPVVGKAFVDGFNTGKHFSLRFTANADKSTTYVVSVGDTVLRVLTTPSE